MIVIATCLIFVAMLLPLRRTHAFVLLVAMQWIGLFAVYFALQDNFVQISAATDLLIAILLASMFLGLIAATSVGSRIEFLPPVFVSPAAVYGCSLLAFLISLALVIRFDWRYVASLAGLRQLLTDPGGMGTPTFGVALSFPLAMAAMMLAREVGHVWLGRLFALGGGLLAVLSTSKIFVLLYVLYLLPVDLDWRSIRLAVLSRYLAVALALVVALHLLLGKVVETGDAGIVSALSLTLASYVASGLAGFELVANQLVDFPNNAVWLQLGQLSGVINVPDSPILPWVQVGTWNTNTYTAFAYWVDGFGLAGASAFAALTGWLGGRLLSLQSLAGRFIARFYVFGIVFLFHQDFFLSAASMWAIYVATAALLWLVPTIRAGHAMYSGGETNGNVEAGGAA